MSSRIGKNISYQFFGESHGRCVGLTIDGLKAGQIIDLDQLKAFMARRAPGGKYATRRKEKDEPDFISGFMPYGENKIITTGFPLTAIIANNNQRSKDYDSLRDIPRPSHADYTAYIKYGGQADMRGGGHFSGRLTAPMCLAGGICKQILEKKGIYTGAHLYNVGAIRDIGFDGVKTGIDDIKSLLKKDFPVIDEDKAKEMKSLIDRVRSEGDSIGASIECITVGIKPGLGGIMYASMESSIAQAIFAIPGVKGIEFGAGFESCQRRGSENNDGFQVLDPSEQTRSEEDDLGSRVRTITNNEGGINGGITNGMPLIFRVAIKPTASIAIEQKSFSISKKENRKIFIKGRHDPCIGIRAVPVIEAVTSMLVLDALS